MKKQQRMSTNNIAVIITCFNRKDKTVACLTHLFKAYNSYNLIHTKSPIQLSIYLTDDGCTDGTADAVRSICEGYDLHIIQGNGQCYWAGGMRLAWKEALKKQAYWDFYLLLNDDTMVCSNVFEQLFFAHDYAIATYHKPGLYSGIICDINNPNKITYGGENINENIKVHEHRMQPQETPTMVDRTNANILLVSKEIVNDIGIFNNGFIHGCADYDYSMQARKNKYPVLITHKICGACENDHLSRKDEIHKLGAMSLCQRLRFLKNPVNSDHDYFLYIKRNMPHKFVISWILRKIRIFIPKLYEMICSYRGLYE